MSLLRTRTQATADDGKESASTEASELLQSFAENLEDTFAIKVGCRSLAHPSPHILQHNMPPLKPTVHQGRFQDTFKLGQATHDAAPPPVSLIPHTRCALVFTLAREVVTCPASRSNEPLDT